MPEQFVSGINLFISGKSKFITSELEPKKYIFLFGTILDILKVVLTIYFVE